MNFCKKKYSDDDGTAGVLLDLLMLRLLVDSTGLVLLVVGVTEAIDGNEDTDDDGENNDANDHPNPPLDLGAAIIHALPIVPTSFQKKSNANRRIRKKTIINHRSSYTKKCYFFVIEFQFIFSNLSVKQMSESSAN